MTVRELGQRQSITLIQARSDDGSEEGEAMKIEWGGERQVHLKVSTHRVSGELGYRCMRKRGVKNDSQVICMTCLEEIRVTLN